MTVEVNELNDIKEKVITIRSNKTLIENKMKSIRSKQSQRKQQS